MTTFFREAGQIIAVNGENGIQADLLMPGRHFWKFPWMYRIDKQRDMQIKDGFVGLITAKDGQSLPPDTVYAPEWANPNKMTDALMGTMLKGMLDQQTTAPKQP